MRLCARLQTPRATRRRKSMTKVHEAPPDPPTATVVEHDTVPDSTATAKSLPDCTSDPGTRPDFTTDPGGPDPTDNRIDAIFRRLARARRNVPRSVEIGASYQAVHGPAPAAHARPAEPRVVLNITTEPDSRRRPDSAQVTGLPRRPLKPIAIAVILLALLATVGGIALFTQRPPLVVTAPSASVSRIPPPMPTAQTANAIPPSSPDTSAPEVAPPPPELPKPHRDMHARPASPPRPGVSSPPSIDDVVTEP